MSVRVFDSLMTHEVTLRQLERDAFGSWSEGAPMALSGFVEYAVRRGVGRDGEEVMTSGTVYLPAEASIDIDSRYVVEHEGRRKEVVMVERVDDPRTGATHHYELGVL